jgi:adenylyl- and sulfurtransferase ThiI
LAVIPVRSSEIALNGRNRRGFTRLLGRNVREALGPMRHGSLRSLSGRLVVPFRDLGQWREAESRLRRLYGVANDSLAVAADRVLDVESRLEMAALVELSLCGKDHESFAIHSCHAVATTQRPASSTKPSGSS